MMAVESLNPVMSLVAQPEMLKADSMEVVSSDLSHVPTQDDEGSGRGRAGLVDDYKTGHDKRLGDFLRQLKCSGYKK
ncbi:unnamed protein product, partial [Allacma fusca]